MSFLDIVKQLAPVAAGIAGSALTGSDILGGAIAGGTSYAINRNPGSAILTGLGTGLGSSLFGASNWLNGGTTGSSPLGSLFGYSGSPLGSLFGGSMGSSATGAAGERGAGNSSGGGGMFGSLFGGGGSSGGGGALSNLGSWAAAHPGVIAGGALGLLSGLSGYTKGTEPVKPAKAAKPGPLDQMSDPNNVVHYIRIPSNQSPPDWNTYGQTGGEHSFFTNAPGSPFQTYAKGGPASPQPTSKETLPWFRYGAAPSWSDKEFGHSGGLTDRRKGGMIPGDGAPEADDVPAMLSSGEHVLDHEDVTRIGKGSNKAGNRKLMEFRQKLNRGPVKGGALSALQALS